MRAARRISVALTVFGLTASFSSATTAVAQTPCEATAQVIREAARHEAWADAWLKVTVCLNDPTCPLSQYLDVVLDELVENLDLAQEQYDARLDVCEDVGPGAYNPQIKPAEYSPDVNNSYFPLVPGRTLVYEEHTSAGTERIEVKTLHQTQLIGGVTCRVVSDLVTMNGEPIEDTLDFYAQHQDGDVWYFGEISKSFEHGLLDNLDGSWRTGKDGAKPGLIMLVAPAVDDIYRQEFLANEAEDMAEIVSLDETVTVPAGTFAHCLEIEEWTPIEPDARALKFYAPGVGSVLEINLRTGDRTELVSIH